MNAGLHRGDAPPPRSVGAVVVAVRNGLRLARAVESLLFFVAGLLLTRAAALVSGLAVEARAEGWSVAALCGALCAACWWLEHPHTSPATARALDGRLRYHGALATAFELERRAAPPLTPMEALVGARVLQRLRTAEAVRALVPPLLVPLAAPTLAALVLVLAVDARRAPEPETLDFLALADGLEQALAFRRLDEELAGLAGEDADGGLSRAQVQELARVLEGRARLPFSAEEWQRAPAETRRALEDLDRRVAELARRVAPASELHAALEEARVWLDALRMGLAAGEARDGAGAAMTEEPGDGTISALPIPVLSPEARPSRPAEPMSESPVPPSAAEPASQALGLQAGNWWPREYDGVVARWLERTRARSER